MPTIKCDLFAPRRRRRWSRGLADGVVCWPTKKTDNFPISFPPKSVGEEKSNETTLQRSLTHTTRSSRHISVALISLRVIGQPIAHARCTLTLVVTEPGRLLSAIWRPIRFILLFLIFPLFGCCNEIVTLYELASETRCHIHNKVTTAMLIRLFNDCAYCVRSECTHLGLCRKLYD